MRDTLGKPARYKPPIDDLPAWAVIYGAHGIVLGYCETEEDVDRQVDALNHQAPQYNHRKMKLK